MEYVCAKYLLEGSINKKNAFSTCQKIRPKYYCIDEGLILGFERARFGMRVGGTTC